MATLAGVLTAAAVMMACEFANSQIFPFPPGLDINDAGQVRQFAASMPLEALILVAVGWISGAMLGGFVATRIASGNSAAPALVTGMLLTALGSLNAWMIQNPLWFHVGGLPVFILFATIGDYLARWRLRNST